MVCRSRGRGRFGPSAVQRKGRRPVSGAYDRPAPTTTWVALMRPSFRAASGGPFRVALPLPNSLAALAAGLVRPSSPRRIHLPASLGSTPVTALRRYYGRSDSCPGRLFGGGSSRMNAARLPRAGLSDSRSRPSGRSASNHPVAPRRRFDTLPISATGFPPTVRGSGVRHWLAGSPVHPAESSSLALRTGPSPPVALHLASRPRSYFQLRAGERVPGEDSHLSDLKRFQTHEPARPRAVLTPVK